mgnify:FL=1
MLPAPSTTSISTTEQSGWAAVFGQFFQRFRRLIDSGFGRRFDLLIGVFSVFCPIKIEVMGTGMQFRTADANVRRP